MERVMVLAATKRRTSNHKQHEKHREQAIEPVEQARHGRESDCPNPSPPPGVSSSFRRNRRPARQPQSQRQHRNGDASGKPAGSQHRRADREPAIVIAAKQQPEVARMPPSKPCPGFGRADRRRDFRSANRAAGEIGADIGRDNTADSRQHQRAIAKQCPASRQNQSASCANADIDQRHPSSQQIPREQWSSWTACVTSPAPFPTTRRAQSGRRKRIQNQPPSHSAAPRHQHHHDAPTASAHAEVGRVFANRRVLAHRPP